MNNRTRATIVVATILGLAILALLHPRIAQARAVTSPIYIGGMVAASMPQRDTPAPATTVPLHPTRPVDIQAQVQLLLKQIAILKMRIALLQLNVGK